MPIEVTVLYPNVSDATFNLDYYLKTHMPLVVKEFGPHGLKGWKVAKSVPTPTTSPINTINKSPQPQNSRHRDWRSRSIQHPVHPPLRH